MTPIRICNCVDCGQWRARRPGASKRSKAKKSSVTPTKARFRRRATHVPNLTDELSTAKEWRLNQFGTAVLVHLCWLISSFIPLSTISW